MVITMEYEVTTLNKIDFGATGVAEILQNVAFILSTPAFSCPLDRGFAWEPEVDMPMMPAEQARLIARITDAIQTYEPRAEVVSVTFRNDPLQGIMQPVVRVRINAEV